MKISRNLATFGALFADGDKVSDLPLFIFERHEGLSFIIEGPITFFISNNASKNLAGKNRFPEALKKFRGMLPGIQKV